MRMVPLVVDRDMAMLHAWVTHPRSVYWEMQDASVADVAREYAAIADSPHHDAFLGLVDNVPQFLVERYDPRHSPLAELPEIEEGDVGMHVLVAPTDQPEHGFTRAVMRAVMRFCFADPAVRRVVVEPDARNSADRRAQRGRRLRRTPPGGAADEDRRPVRRHPRVLRALRPRERDPLMTLTAEAPATVDDVAHLNPATLARAQRGLVAKAITEFTHERLIAPVARW